EVDPGRTCTIPVNDRTQVAYILEGDDATITHSIGGQTATHAAARRSGVYLEPGKEAPITASAAPLLLLLVTVPKHSGKATGNDRPRGYFFEEGRLRSLIDE